MSGLIDEGGRIIYLNIKFGKICRTVNKDFPGAVAREVNGEVRFEKYYKAIKGILVDIKRDKSKVEGLPDQYKFFFETDDGLICLNMGIKDREAMAFIKTMPNIDFSKEITLNPWQIEVDGGKRSGLSVYQDGSQDRIPFYYLKETPNGLPIPKQVEFDGEKKWDFSEQRSFLEKMMMEEVKPKLKGLDSASDGASEGVKKQNDELPPEDDDDLPF